MDFHAPTRDFGFIICINSWMIDQMTEIDMKNYRQELWFNTPTRVAFVNITPQVRDCIRESGVKEGLALVNAMHITASVFINDDESGLHEDYTVWLEKLAPARADPAIPA